MTRRSQFEIYVDVLKAVSEGRRKPTHIMYRANLTWKRLKKHTDFLIAHGLLVEEHDGEAKIFTLTSSGKDVVWYYMKIEREILQTKKIAPSEIYSSISLPQLKSN